MHNTVMAQVCCVLGLPGLGRAASLGRDRLLLRRKAKLPIMWRTTFSVKYLDGSCKAAEHKGGVRPAGIILRSVWAWKTEG